MEISRAEITCRMKNIQAKENHVVAIVVNDSGKTNTTPLKRRDPQQSRPLADRIDLEHKDTHSCHSLSNDDNALTMQSLAPSTF
ncbi:hypothetical protein ACSQ67_012951 [Phaseolus vulgaris]